VLRGRRYCKKVIL
jgi:hypothetical protein